jgi:hypothetical protein
MTPTQDQIDALMRNPDLWHPGVAEGISDGLMEDWLLAVQRHPMPAFMLRATMEKLVSHLSGGKRQVVDVAAITDEAAALQAANAEVEQLGSALHLSRAVSNLNAVRAERAEAEVARLRDQIGQWRLKLDTECVTACQTVNFDPKSLQHMLDAMERAGRAGMGLR